jgi:hypothetical protein
MTPVFKVRADGEWKAQEGKSFPDENFQES